MVCNRCLLVVRQTLQALNFDVKNIGLGWVEVGPEPNPDQLHAIASAFKVVGFELIDDYKTKLVEQVRNLITETVQYSDLSQLNINFSTLLTEKLQKPYPYLSNLFSEQEGNTIEHYIIQQKVEKIKELMEYGDLNLNEIALKMGYSSSAHLSAQFKKITGFSPSQYRNSKSKRKALDEL
ncbi:helix-turn-helix domain-containing protein [Mucilaginibacter sp. HMF7410]|uniref:Helix-turn-helix domain-containing protein n=2 Tax=Mucilaginibacter arboris TaxID=2682090 RepID=A0A7K1SZ04_9SPHI|nr:helix-turn-helix domain-containing protein [Mucilaginibacter arboris]